MAPWDRAHSRLGSSSSASALPPGHYYQPCRGDSPETGLGVGGVIAILGVGLHRPEHGRAHVVSNQPGHAPVVNSAGSVRFLPSTHHTTASTYFSLTPALIQAQTGDQAGLLRQSDKRQGVPGFATQRQFGTPPGIAFRDLFDRLI